MLKPSLKRCRRSTRGRATASVINYIPTPEVATYPLFSDAGSYRVKVIVTLAEGNPVTFYAPISVES